MKNSIQFNENNKEEIPTLEVKKCNRLQNLLIV